jgi:hydrogenase maturation protein HypF
MPGGEKAVTEPARMAFSYLYDAIGEDALNIDIGLSDSVKKALKSMVDKGINTPLTCGLGRMFDAVSALLGVCLTRTFEGEPAVMLEMAAGENVEENYPFKIAEGSEYVVDTAPIINRIVEDMRKNTPIKTISRRFHETIVRITVELADTIRLEEGINNIVLSGGVFQNRIISSRVKRLAEEKGLKTFFNNIVPTNDGGISLGQVVASGLTGEE